MRSETPVAAPGSGSTIVQPGLVHAGGPPHVDVGEIVVRPSGQDPHR